MKHYVKCNYCHKVEFNTINAIILITYDTF